MLQYAAGKEEKIMRTIRISRSRVQFLEITIEHTLIRYYVKVHPCFYYYYLLIRLTAIPYHVIKFLVLYIFSSVDYRKLPKKTNRIGKPAASLGRLHRRQFIRLHFFCKKLKIFYEELAARGDCALNRRRIPMRRASVTGTCRIPGGTVPSPQPFIFSK